MLLGHTKAYHFNPLSFCCINININYTPTETLIIIINKKNTSNDFMHEKTFISLFIYFLIISFSRQWHFIISLCIYTDRAFFWKRKFKIFLSFSYFLMLFKYKSQKRLQQCSTYAKPGEALRVYFDEGRKKTWCTTYIQYQSCCGLMGS